MNETNDSNLFLSNGFINESTNESIIQTYHRIGNTFGDVLSPAVKEYVPIHWLQFEAPACYVHYILGVLYILILIPGLGANSIVIYLFFKCKSLRSSSNVFLLNLAFSDLLMNLKMPAFVINSFCCGPITGKLGCEMYGFVGGMSGTSAIMSIALMSRDRFKVISNPLNPRPSTRRAVYLCVSVWIYSLCFSAPPLLGLLNRYVPEGYLTSCSFDYLSEDIASRLYIFVFFIGAFCVPMAIIIYSYVGIVFVVKRSRLVFSESKTDSQVSQGKNFAKYQNQRNNEIKLAKIAFCLITLWVLSWSPYAIVALIGIFYDQSLLTPTASMVPGLFAKSSSILNPFVYALSHPKFKHELKRTFIKGYTGADERTTEAYALSSRGPVSKTDQF